MDIFRVATAHDIEAIYAFTQHADAGLTTVPHTRQSVADYISESRKFLRGEVKANRLLFVVERAGQILGISGIIPTLGLERPFYSFKRSRHARRSSSMDMSVKYDTLQLTTDFDGFTELASIYLSPDARGQGIGRLMSLGRLAFIERHSQMFHDRLMADIRGWVNADGRSPFWDELTSKFIQTDFSIADRLSASDGRFIIELLPALPILLNLLPDSVNACAGRPHDLSAGARAMLLEAGFETTDFCDIFDGGPAIDCKTKATLIARSAVRATQFSCSNTETLGLNFGGYLERFRAIMGPVDLGAANGTAGAYDVVNDDVFIALMHDRRQKARL